MSWDSRIVEDLGELTSDSQSEPRRAGRKGVQKCVRCRKNKQKCNPSPLISENCTRCLENGYICGGYLGPNDDHNPRRASPKISASQLEKEILDVVEQCRANGVDGNEILAHLRLLLVNTDPTQQWAYQDDHWLTR